MVDRFERFSLAIYELSRYWHKIAADEMEKYGLKGPYAVYFTTLYRSPEGITAARLSEVSGRDKADVSRAIAAMEKQGLVTKEGTQYRALLKLSPAGMQAARQINERARVAVELGGQGLTPSTREIFYNAMEQIVANLQTISEKGLPASGKAQK
ncbi:MAG: MarR family transcriptional regulator [Clostridia bacterium]|nr:MarR family transcriptional regulator [Clostridia bacterium]